MRPGTIYNLLSNSDKNPNGYPASVTQTGQVVCGDEEIALLYSLMTYAWVSSLVIFHILLLVVLTSLGAIMILNTKWTITNADDESNKKRFLVNSPNLMVAAMPVLAVGAAAEVAQHIFDNWLYLGLVPTYYLATFYSGMALGQSLLALGVWNGPPGYWSYVLPIASVLSFVSIAYSGIVCTRRAAAAAAGPDLTYGDCLSFLPFLSVFITLAFSTLFIFLKARAPVPMRKAYGIKAFLALFIGIGSSLILTSTGWQWLHLPTAGGFLGLFVSELAFIKRIPEAYKSERNDEPQSE